MALEISIIQHSHEGGWGVTLLKLPARIPNLNDHAERRVRSVEEEVRSGVIQAGESAIRKAFNEYGTHYH